MFNNPRYLTIGIKNKIQLAVQFILWEMIEEMQVEKKDYLQVFKLVPVEVDGDMVQRITHTQEQPPYEKIITLNKLTPPVNAKIFVIDDVTHSTMLLADEY